MLLKQIRFQNYSLKRNCSIYIPFVTKTLFTNQSNLYHSKCAINQLNNQLNSLIHQYNDHYSTLNDKKPIETTLISRTSIDNRFKLFDLTSIFYLLKQNNMETDNLVNSLKKAFKNENVNEIIHSRMMSSSINKTGANKQFNFQNFDHFQKTHHSSFKKNELLDSSILSKFKHVYQNTLNRLRFCSYHLKVNFVLLKLF